MRTIATILLAILILGNVAGCARHRYLPGQRDGDERLKKELEASIAQVYPEQFKLEQRISLVIHFLSFLRGHKQYDFIGYLRYKSPDLFQALALGEMGGTVFDFYARGTERKILKKPARMPAGPLVDGVMGDIRHLYDWSPKAGAYLIRREEGKVGLVVPLGKDQLKEYLFRQGEKVPFKSVETVRGRVIREVQYQEYRKLKGWRQSIPTRIALNDYHWHYSLAIEVLRIEPLPAHEKILAVDQ